MSILRSEQLIDYAKNLYASDKITVSELEDRIHRAITGEASDQEWIEAARYQRWTQPITRLGDPVWFDDLETAEQSKFLKAHYIGPIQEHTA